MDKSPVLENRDREHPSSEEGVTPLLARLANPNSWFRQRLDQVRKQKRRTFPETDPRLFEEK